MLNQNKKIILILAAILCLVVFVVLFFRTESTVAPAPPQEKIKINQTKIWFKKKEENLYLLYGDSNLVGYDTLQIAFKNQKTVMKDFVSSPQADFDLKIKFNKNQVTILLFSTDGQGKDLKPNLALGEMTLVPGTLISDFTFDEEKSKIVLAGKSSPVVFEGIKP